MYPNSQEEFNIINTEEAEENFPDDDDNTEVEEMIYRENCWPSKEPTGFTYKSKKYIFNTGLAIARPVFWKPGCTRICMYVCNPF